MNEMDALLLIREQERMKLWRNAFLQRADRSHEIATTFADKACEEFLSRFEYGYTFKPKKTNNDN